MRPLSIAFPLLAATLLGAPLPHAHADGPVRGLTFAHQDWYLACDNTRTCRAAGYQAGDAHAPDARPVSLLLVRRAGPDEPVHAQLALEHGDRGPPRAPLSLRIDGRDAGRLATDGGDTARLSPSQLAALLAALQRSTRIAIVAGDGHQWQLSDRGATAVLLKMDEFQGRLETRGALVRKGDRDDTGVLPPLPAPVVRIPPLPATTPADTALASSPALRDALRASLPGGTDCAGLDMDEEDAPPLELVPLAPGKLLASTRCWLAAYNAGIGYWVVNARPPFAPRLVTTSGSDYHDGRIAAAQKGRGLGDCWWTAEWSWDGRAFVQTSEADSGPCRGFAGGAWDMPTLVGEVVR